MAVSSNRMLGGVGASLLVVGAFSPLLVLPRLLEFYSTGTITGTSSPFLSVLGLASLAGLILFMVAMKGFAHDYKDSGIFNNALYGVLSTIIVGVLAAGLIIAVVLMNFSGMIQTLNPVPQPTDIFQSVVGYVVPVMPVVSLAGLAQALFMMRAFNLLAAKSEVRLFRTAGWALVAGSLLAIVLAAVGVLLFFAASLSAGIVLTVPIIGTMVSYLAWVFAAKAFFTIKEPTAQAHPAAPARQVKYCTHCGAENLPDAVFCTRCGKNL
jgi:uncharacterized membrane protein/ribosomal protein L40E